MNIMAGKHDAGAIAENSNSHLIQKFPAKREHKGPV